MFKGHENSIMHSAKLVGTNTSLPSGSNIAIDLNDTTDPTYRDPFGLRTSNTQVTIKSPGLYTLVGCTLFNPPASSGATVGSWRSIALNKNAAQLRLTRMRPNLDGNFSGCISVVYHEEFIQGDVLTLVARYQGSGTISAGGGPYTFLALQQVTKELS